MKQKKTNVKRETERVVVTLSIRRGKGYALGKWLIYHFNEEGTKYRFLKTKKSMVFMLKDLYIKVYYSYYDNNNIEICLYRNNPKTKVILEGIMEEIKPNVVTSERNMIFASSYRTYRKGAATIDYSVEENKFIYNISTTVSYRSNHARLNYSDCLTISMKLSKGMICFVPNLISKIFSEIKDVRMEIKGEEE